MHFKPLFQLGSLLTEKSINIPLITTPYLLFILCSPVYNEALGFVLFLFVIITFFQSAHVEYGLSVKDLPLLLHNPHKICFFSTHNPCLLITASVLKTNHCERLKLSGYSGPFDKERILINATAKQTIKLAVG